MVEAVVTAGLAVIAGGYSVVTALHRRVTTVDTRLDRIELSMAKDYITRSEYAADLNKLEDHMIRIEKKLDVFIQQFSKRSDN